VRVARCWLTDVLFGGSLRGKMRDRMSLDRQPTGCRRSVHDGARACCTLLDGGHFVRRVCMWEEAGQDVPRPAADRMSALLVCRSACVLRAAGWRMFCSVGLFVGRCGTGCPSTGSRQDVGAPWMMERVHVARCWMADILSGGYPCGKMRDRMSLDRQPTGCRRSLYDGAPWM
jgi:hypothetical protein